MLFRNSGFKFDNLDYNFIEKWRTVGGKYWCFDLRGNFYDMFESHNKCFVFLSAGSWRKEKWLLIKNQVGIQHWRICLTNEIAYIRWMNQAVKERWMKDVSVFFVDQLNNNDSNTNDNVCLEDNILLYYQLSFRVVNY